MINNLNFFHIEPNWKGIQVNGTFKDPCTMIKRHEVPYSNFLNEMNREHFNIFKTEDGLRQFFKTKINPPSILQYKRLDKPVNFKIKY